MSFTAEEQQQVADFEKLSAEYRARTNKYNELLKVYRDGEANNRPNPELKAFLDKEYDDLHRLFDQLTAMQQKLAQAQEAALA